MEKSYCIYMHINVHNHKVYIGQTRQSIQDRWTQHKANAKSGVDYLIYRAMRKYGIEHFHIELIEETDKPEEREVYWIEQKRSFKYGYNATMGGDGKRYIDYDLVITTYLQVQNQNEVARLLNISKDTVHFVLISNNIEIATNQTVNAKLFGKIINQYDLDGNFLQSFSSARSAAASLGKITNTSHGASSHIADVCKGKRKTAYGFIWKYANEENIS